MTESTELNIEELKNEASELGIKFSAQIGAEKLKEKIEKHYKDQETPPPAVKEDEKDDTSKDKVETKVTTGKVLSRKDKKRIEREKSARKTRVVTVIDNDQRVNNTTTTCVVNCSNEFFDLGLKILPLNEKIEVSQGHINVLKSVMIPLHTRNNKTGLSDTKLRPRYSVSYED